MQSRLPKWLGRSVDSLRSHVADPGFFVPRSFTSLCQISRRWGRIAYALLSVFGSASGSLCQLNHRLRVSSLIAHRIRGLLTGHYTTLGFAAAFVVFTLPGIAGVVSASAQEKPTTKECRAANLITDSLTLTAQQHLELLDRCYGSDIERYIGAVASVVNILSCPKNLPYQRRLLDLIERRDGSKSENFSNVLANLAGCLLDTDDKANAEAALERLLVLDEQLHGETRVTAKTLNNLAVAYKSNGKLSRAEQAYRRSLSILLQTVPDTDPYLEKSLENLVSFYTSVGRQRDALPYQQKQLAELRARLPAPADPPLSSIELDVLKGKVVMLTRQARFAEALNAAERLLAVTEAQFGKESPESAEVVGRIGLISCYAGDYNRAERQYNQALEMLNRLPDRGGQLRATVEQNLGRLYLEQRRYSDAEPILKRVLKNAEQTLIGDPDLAYAYNNLGSLYYRLRRYSEAEPLLAKALSIRESAVGIDKDLLAISFDNLGLVFLDTKRFPDAERLFTRAYELFSETLGATHPDTLMALMNLASVWERTGELQRALDLLTSAVGATVAAHGEAYPISAELLRRRGLLHYHAGRFSLAQADLLRALSAVEGHPSRDADAAQILLGLSKVYLDAHDYSGADQALERAERINDRLRIFDDDTLAVLYKLRGRALDLQNRGGAADYIEKALNIRERILAVDDPLIAVELNNLATALAPSDPERARSLLIRAIAINEANHCDCVALANAYNNLGSVHEQLGEAEMAEAAYRKSVELNDRLLGAAGPGTMTGRSNLALLLTTMSRTEEAVVLAEARAAGFEENLVALLPFGTREQKHLFVRSQNPFSLFGTLGMARPLAQAVFRYKGVVTESVLSEYRAAGRTTSPERAAALECWRDARRALTQVTVEDSAGKQRPGEAGLLERIIRDRLRAQLIEAEAELARLGSAPVDTKGAFALTVSDVQAKIPSDAVLLDFVRYSHYLGKVKQEDRYGVIVLASRGEPEWVPLGNAWQIEQLIERLYHVSRGSDPVNTIRGVVAVLYGQLLEPVIRFVPKTTKRLLIVPDGDVNFVPFAALLTSKNRLVAEQFSITYLSTARDLLRSASRPTEKRMSIYANPSFRVGRQTPARTPAGLLPPGFQYPTLRPLPFTDNEAKTIESVAKKNGWRVDRHRGQAASEQALYREKKPGILHLATHGFLLSKYGTELVLAADAYRGVGGVRPRPVSPDVRPSSTKKRPIGTAEAYQKGLITSVKVIDSTDPAFEDPMLRSAVALAGAQVTLEAWRSGKVPRMAQDGILNAEEVAMLDLDGTWLVTLSSCESGLGDAEPGEGVVGLRRGLLQVGAQAILTTLWPIDDAFTASLMADFYRKALPSGDASAALADVQRRLLMKLRKERGLDEAVRLAGGFVITLRAAPLP